MTLIEIYNGELYIKTVREDKITLQELKSYMQSNNIKELELKTKGDEPRSNQQNRALHKYFSWIANKLNEAGFDVAHTIKADTSWTMNSVKELMWRPLQKTLIGI